MVRRVATFAFGVTLGIVVLWVMTSRSTPEAEPPFTAMALAVANRASATPSIAIDGQVVAIAWGGTSPSGAADVFVSVSADGSRSFGVPVRVNDQDGTARLSGEMAPRVTVLARKEQPALVQVLWTAKGIGTTIRMARSEDGGRTFASSQQLQADGADGDRGWAALAMSRDGRPHVVWLDHRAMQVRLKPDTTTRVEPETTVGASATLHHGHERASAGSSTLDGVEMAQKSAIYYSDGAATERAIAHGVCYCCKTALAVGDGRVFAAWRHVYPGNLRDIAFASSSEHDLGFTPPVRVSEDEWQIDGCPDDGPAMALGPDGAVHLVWPTVVSQPETHKAMFYATSRDGQRFSSRVRITPEGRNIAHPQIAVGNEGRVAVFWDEIVEGRRRVFLRRLRSGTFTDEEALSEAESASYPVAGFTDTALVVAWTEGPPESSRIVVRRVPLK